MGAGISVVSPNGHPGLQIRLALYVTSFIDAESELDTVKSSAELCTAEATAGRAMPVDQTASCICKVQEYYTNAVLHHFCSMAASAKTRGAIPIVHCGFLEFEECIEEMFSRGITPILLDSSPDDKACTFYSYQPDYVLFEAKSMVMDHARGVPLMHCLEMGRKFLVNAMKFGKTLVVRMGNSVPDFINIFNDSVLARELGGDDLRRKQKGYLPLEIFEQAGGQLREESNGWPYILFRDEDMKPHKNFAYCKDSFRVMLASQLSVDEAEHCFWGWNTAFSEELKRQQLLNNVEKGTAGKKWVSSKPLNSSRKKSRRVPHLPPSSKFGIVCIVFDGYDDVET
jgi:hypothetical protein